MCNLIGEIHMAVGKKSRNGLADIMRLVFALIVMMFHFYSSGEKHFHGGFFGVEYFVILSGLLFFSAWDRERSTLKSIEERQHYWLSYVKRRYIRFFWHSMVAFAFAFFVVRVWHDKVYSISGICDNLTGDIWEILLVKMNGFNRGRGLLIGTNWTLCCMLFVELFTLGMLTFCERPFLTLLMPLMVFLGTGYWMNLETNTHSTFLGLFTFGMLRVCLLNWIGIFAYLICKKLKAIAFSKTGRWVLTGVELLGYGLCVLITLYRSGRNYQFCFILIATFVLAISFSGKSFAGNMFPANSFTNFCAEFSLGLYLTHYTVYRIFRYLYVDIDERYRQKFVFLFCALAAALVYTFIMRGLFKMLPIVKQKLKSVMLERT